MVFGILFLTFLKLEEKKLGVVAHLVGDLQLLEQHRLRLRQIAPQLTTNSKNQKGKFGWGPVAVEGAEEIRRNLR